MRENQFENRLQNLDQVQNVKDYRGKIVGCFLKDLLDKRADIL